MILIGLSIYFLVKGGYDIYIGKKRRNELNSKPKLTDTAIVINERDVYPNQGHLDIEKLYKYTFIVNNKTYKGACLSGMYKPGDKILIDYVIDSPQYNRPASSTSKCSKALKF